MNKKIQIKTLGTQLLGPIQFALGWFSKNQMMPA